MSRSWKTYASRQLLCCTVNTWLTENDWPTVRVSRADCRFVNDAVLYSMWLFQWQTTADCKYTIVSGRFDIRHSEHGRLRLLISAALRPPDWNRLRFSFRLGSKCPIIMISRKCNPPGSPQLVQLSAVHSINLENTYCSNSISTFRHSRIINNIYLYSVRIPSDSFKLTRSDYRVSLYTIRLLKNTGNGAATKANSALGRLGYFRTTFSAAHRNW